MVWHVSYRNPSLGLTTKAMGCKVVGQEGDSRVNSGVQKVWGNEPSHSQVNSHVGSWSLKRTPKFSERDYRGQNLSPRRVLYIIGKLLKRRCLSETQVITKRKVENRPDFLMCRWCVTYLWKALNEGYNFTLNCIAIGGLHRKLCTSKVARISIVGISRLPSPFGCGPHGEAHNIL